MLEQIEEETTLQILIGPRPPVQRDCELDESWDEMHVRSEQDRSCLMWWMTWTHWAPSNWTSRTRTFEPRCIPKTDNKYNPFILHM